MNIMYLISTWLHVEHFFILCMVLLCLRWLPPGAAGDCLAVRGVYVRVNGDLGFKSDAL